MMVSTLLLAIGLAGLPAETTTFSYRDAHDPDRVIGVGTVTPEYDPADSSSGLALAISAVGPEVSGAPGWTGVRGANRITAQQLSRLLDGSNPHRVVLREASSGQIWDAPFRVTSHAGVPIRRIGPDGTIDYAAMSAPLPTRLEVRAPVDLPAGTEAWLDLVVLDRVEVSIPFIVGDGGPSVLGVEFRPEHVHATPVVAAQILATPSAPPPIEADAWALLDADQRWMTFERSRLADPESIPGWIDFLFDVQDYDFLEALCLYHFDAFEGWRVGQRLAEADAPNWARVVYWGTGSRGGHGDILGRRLRNFGYGPQLDAYRRRFPKASIERPALAPDQEPGAIKAADLWAEGQRPPLVIDRVLGAAMPGVDVIEFDPSAPSEPGVVYLHQVERATRGLVIANLHISGTRLTDVTRHDAPSVRREAFLAMTYAKPQQVALARCWEAHDDAGETPAVREAAVLAMSYSIGPPLGTPHAFMRLHEIAADTDHPGWRAAISRLGDLGDEFTRRWLSAVLESGAIEEADRPFVEANRDRIAGPPTDPRQLVLRVCWADAAGSILFPEIRAWAYAQSPLADDEQIRSSWVAWCQSYDNTTGNLGGLPDAAFQRSMQTTGAALIGQVE